MDICYKLIEMIIIIIVDKVDEDKESEEFDLIGLDEVEFDKVI